MAALSAVNTFIFLKRLRKKIIFCWNQFTGKAINSGKPVIKQNTQTFPKMWDALQNVSYFPSLKNMYIKKNVHKKKHVHKKNHVHHLKRAL